MKAFRANKIGIFEINCKYQDHSNELFGGTLEAQPFRVEVLGHKKWHEQQRQKSFQIKKK